MSGSIILINTKTINLGIKDRNISTHAQKKEMTLTSVSTALSLARVDDVVSLHYCTSLASFQSGMTMTWSLTTSSMLGLTRNLLACMGYHLANLRKSTSLMMVK